MQILIKTVLTGIAGALTWFLVNLTDQPAIWQITMAVFVAGVVLVVQFLIEAAEQSRRLVSAVRDTSADQVRTVRTINAAATHLADAAGNGGQENIVRLVGAAGRMDSKQDLQLRFAEHQVAGLVTLLEGLHAGRAEHEGENPDWLLGLTDTAAISIDATSITSFDRHRGFVDEGEFWVSDLGLRYLDRQRKAIERNVRIRRLFLLTEDATDVDQLEKLLEPHQKINVETRILRPDDIDFLHQHDLEDFILFDQKISYEFHTARALKKDVTPLIASVALVVDPRLVARRRERFEELWSAAADPDEPNVA
ncbi:hypothetical protein JIG36_46995 [Actinoplanes sp. LDG1-06]|uniref:DUF6879 domain-containing protein n=1 Tax=Paractinoplanes ovalisporus TaxID=2810368 RepID=A0ABS2ATM7_9ACTN|nr:DUF6879 family protein [Actinoplanes ovalisporus]MBM2623073.1 hypothetical protein [Actinoplanes ovalisporus]